MKKVYISYPLGDDYMRSAATAREICAAAFRLFGIWAVCPAAMFDPIGSVDTLAEVMGPCTEAWFFQRDESCRDEIEQAERMGIPVLEKVATAHAGRVEDITDASEGATPYEGRETPRARLQRVFISMGRKTGKTASTEAVLDNMLEDILDAIEREWPEEGERVCLYDYKKGRPADITYRNRNIKLSDRMDHQATLQEIRSMTGASLGELSDLEGLAGVTAWETGRTVQHILERVRSRIASGVSWNDMIAEVKAGVL